MKIAIIGAGNVGSMVAARVVEANLADVVLVDIVEGLAKGKALDISDVRSITNSTVDIIGSENFSDIKDSNVVVITAGLTRKPGASRDDLLRKNAQIVKDLSNQIKKYCPGSIALVVTNPLDIMSYIVMKTTGFSPQKIIGMAGVLDTARLLNIIREKGIQKDKFFLLGSHGDSMVAVTRSKEISLESFEEAALATRNRGAEIVKNLKTGSAYFAPSMAVFYMLEAIIKNEKRIMCASCYLNGEYGEKDIYIGVPVKLGSGGAEEIIQIELTKDEREAFKRSAEHIREGIKQALSF